MDYLEFFNLADEPFGHAPLPRFYFASEQHTNALSRLMYAANRAKGLALLIGDIGRGKTTLARRMLDSLPENQFEAAMLVMVHTGITPSWLLKRIAIQLGVVDPADDKLTILSQLYQRLVQIHQSGRKALVLIDEAQMLQSREIMEEFRGLLNLELPGHKLISFVFFGLPPVEHYLALDPPLAQRVALRYRLGALSAEDTVNYIQHRLQLVGGDPGIFPGEALAAVHQYSEGVPRVINTLCDNVLLELFFAQQRAADAELVVGVAENLNLGADTASFGRAAADNIEAVAIDETPAVAGGPGADAIVVVGREEDAAAPDAAFSADDIAARVAREPPAAGELDAVNAGDTAAPADADADDIDVDVEVEDADEDGVAAGDLTDLEIHVSPEGDWDEAPAAEQVEIDVDVDVDVDVEDDGETAGADDSDADSVVINLLELSDLDDEEVPEVDIADPLEFLQGDREVDGEGPTPFEAALASDDHDGALAEAPAQAGGEGLDDLHRGREPVELFEEVTEADSAAEEVEVAPEVDALGEGADADADAGAVAAARIAAEQAFADAAAATKPSAPESPPAPNETQRQRFTTKTGKVIDLAEIDDLLADLD